MSYLAFLGPDDLPEYPEAHSALVRALSDFIEVNDHLRREYLRSGAISIAQAKVDAAALEDFRALRDKLLNDALASYGKTYEDAAG